MCQKHGNEFAALEARMLHEKTIGKPYAGNPHVRFDEGLLACA